MIDLSQLSQTQAWGLAFATQQANKPIEAENQQIANANANLPEGQEPAPLKDLLTVQQYADQVFAAACDSYWRQCQQYGLEQQVVPTAMALPLEQQLALRAQFGLPDIIPPEYLAQLPQ